jgi:phosphoribosylformylglycinamidine cyclo-ligase
MKNEKRYAQAGVDIDAAERVKFRLGEMVKKTFNKNVFGDFGNFGSLYSAKGLGAEKFLVSSADGVGTKLKIAFMANRHDTVGHDLVNHLVNDILCLGARPLFFLDYIGLGKMDEETVVSIVRGIADGCEKNECALLGGETAEMPGFYQPGEYDLAGFIVGVVDKKSIPSKKKIKAGDILIGFSSSGLHTNGYTLARKAFFEIGKMSLDNIIPETGTKLGDELLQIHTSYFETIHPFIKDGTIKCLAHITGGGFEGNISRILPPNVDAIIDPTFWKVPGLFKAIQRLANVETSEMFRVFNMGIGMVGITSPKSIPVIRKKMKAPNCEVVPMGAIVKGTGKIKIKI